MIKSILIELLAIFLSCDKAKPHDEIQDDEFVKFINDYIKNHIHEKISVKSLSNLMGFNEKYFISIFNKHFGITPALYIKHMRLETAKYDLLYTDHSIAFIADTIGFSTIQKILKNIQALRQPNSGKHSNRPIIFDGSIILIIKIFYKSHKYRCRLCSCGIVFRIKCCVCFSDH